MVWEEEEEEWRRVSELLHADYTMSQQQANDLGSFPSPLPQQQTMVGDHCTSHTHIHTLAMALI